MRCEYGASAHGSRRARGTLVFDPDERGEKKLIFPKIERNKEIMCTNLFRLLANELIVPFGLHSAVASL